MHLGFSGLRWASRVGDSLSISGFRSARLVRQPYAATISVAEIVYPVVARLRMDLVYRSVSLVGRFHTILSLKSAFHDPIEVCVCYSRGAVSGVSVLKTGFILVHDDRYPNLYIFEHLKGGGKDQLVSAPVGLCSRMFIVGFPQ